MNLLKFFKKSSIIGLTLISCIVSITAAQNLKDFGKEVTEFTLPNGLHFIVLERHEAPIVSFHTFANVGSTNEVIGITGMAHMFEHMAFKGSKTVGTTDYKAESEAIAKVDDAFSALKTEREKKNPDPEKMKTLEDQFKEDQNKAEKYLVHDEFEEAFIRAGSSGLNAGTAWDWTRYMVSLPSNKVELWMSLESDRFLNPVFREFYKERDVVMEERRMRTDSQPIGRLIEDFMAMAYKAHPYGKPPIGFMSDLQTFTREEAREFFNTYYTPNNMVITIVGDVEPANIEKLAQIYFGRIPGKPTPPPVETVEPEQLGERRVILEDPSQPFVLIGYHKPDINHPDNGVFDAITEIIGVGRTSRLYKSLVKDKKIAVAASGFQGLPGNKYPGLFLFYAVPAKGHGNEECEQAIYDVIDNLKNELVTPEELDKAKTRSRADLIRQLDSNSGLAGQLAFYEVLTGDWRNLFKQLGRINKVTAEDIQRVVKDYFTSQNRTVGVIKTTQSES